MMSGWLLLFVVAMSSDGHNQAQAHSPQRTSLEPEVLQHVSVHRRLRACTAQSMAMHSCRGSDTPG